MNHSDPADAAIRPQNIFAGTITLDFKYTDRGVRYILTGKPQKWMHKRARDFRADRRKYRRWVEGGKR